MLLIGCDQSAFCCCATCRCEKTCRRGQLLLRTIRTARIMANPSPLSLVRNPIRIAAHPGDRIIRCHPMHGIQWNLRILPPSERDWRPRRGRHPQPVHKARLIIRSKPTHSKKNICRDPPLMDSPPGAQVACSLACHLARTSCLPSRIALPPHPSQRPLLSPSRPLAPLIGNLGSSSSFEGHTRATRKSGCAAQATTGRLSVSDSST